MNTAKEKVFLVEIYRINRAKWDALARNLPLLKCNWSTKFSQEIRQLLCNICHLCNTCAAQVWILPIYNNMSSSTVKSLNYWFSFVNMPSTHADWLNEKILEKGILLWYNPLRSFGTNKSNTHKKVSLCFELLCFVSVYHQFQSLVVVSVTKGQRKIWGRCSCRLKFTSRTWLVNWMKHELPSFLYL